MPRGLGGRFESFKAHVHSKIFEENVFEQIK